MLGTTLVLFDNIVLSNNLITVLLFDPKLPGLVNPPRFQIDTRCIGGPSSVSMSRRLLAGFTPPMPSSDISSDMELETRTARLPDQ